MAAAAIPWIMAAGTAVSAIGLIQQGQAASKAAKYNAALGRLNQIATENQTITEAAKARRAAYKHLGSMRAAYGASGISLEGSPLDVLAESAATAEMDALSIEYGGKFRADMYGAGADLDLASGRNARDAGYMNAGASLLMGGAQSYDAYLRRAG